MKIQAVLILLMINLSGCLHSAEDSDAWIRVDAKTFHANVEEMGDAFILDVRTSEEWEDDGHLEGAFLVQHDEIELELDNLPTDKDTTILLYCRSGNRSQVAAKALVTLGFTDIIELESGINGWMDAGYPVNYGA
jgi:rhodanese-related sulfurtransferase